MVTFGYPWLPSLVTLQGLYEPVSHPPLYNSASMQHQANYQELGGQYHIAAGIVYDLCYRITAEAVGTLLSDPSE